MVLRSIQRVARTRRRIFGKRLPRWASDIFGKLAFLNTFPFLLPIIAIGLAPEHFFRQMKSISDGNRAYYASPVNFLWKFVVVAAAYLAIRLQYVNGSVGPHSLLVLLGEQGATSLYVLLVVATSPVWIVVLAALANGLSKETPLLLLPLSVLMRQKYWRPEIFATVTSRATYQALNWQRYCLAMLYFGAYSVVITLALSWMTFYFAVYAFAELGRVGVFVFSLAAFAIFALLIRPYAVLLRTSVVFPPLVMQFADAAQLERIVRRQALTRQNYNHWRRRLREDERKVSELGYLATLKLTAERAAVYGAFNLGEYAVIHEGDSTDSLVVALHADLQRIRSGMPLQAGTPVASLSTDIASSEHSEATRRDAGTELGVSVGQTSDASLRGFSDGAVYENFKAATIFVVSFFVVLIGLELVVVAVDIENVEPRAVSLCALAILWVGARLADRRRRLRSVQTRESAEDSRGNR